MKTPLLELLEMRNKLKKLGQKEMLVMLFVLMLDMIK
jgi:hypothetical protein